MSGMLMAAAAASARSGGGLDSDAATYIARFTVEPDNARKTAINNLFIALKDAGVYAKLNMLFVPKKAQDSQSGLLDLKRHTEEATIVGVASWDADLGFVGSVGDNRYIDSNYTPSTDASGGVTATNIGVGVYATDIGFVSPAAGTTYLAVAYSILGDERISLQVYGDNTTNWVLSSYLFGSANNVAEPSSTTEPFFYHLNRTAADSLTAYRNCVSRGTNNTTATRTLTTNSVRFLAYASDGSTGVNGAVGAAWLGEPLTTTEQSDLKTALDNYFSAL